MRGDLTRRRSWGGRHTSSISPSNGSQAERGSPPGGRRYRLEVRAALVREVVEDVGPVVARVPRDARGRVDLDGHDLADVAALDEHDRAADAARLAAAVLAAEDVLADERVVVGHVRAGHDVCRLDGESARARDVSDRFGRQCGGGARTS